MTVCGLYSVILMLHCIYIDCGRVLFGSRVAETRSRGHSAVTALIIRHDDWDVYYDRGRKPKESKTKDEAARSEGDYRNRKMLLAGDECASWWAPFPRWGWGVPRGMQS